MSRPRSSRAKEQLREAARVQQELEKRVFHLKTLYEVSREISLVGDTASITKALLMMVVGTFGAERGLMVVVDPRDNRLAAAARRGCDAEAETALTAAVTAGTIAKLCGAGEALVRHEADASGLVGSLGLHLWIPFTVNDTLVGGLGLGAKLTEEAYSDDDAELLVTLANQAAAALRTAAAHEQLVRYNHELAATLRRLQILESMKMNLAKFVPRTVQALIEASPEAPLLDKRETDVSVLFADITGYTALSAQMELERVNQLVEVYFGAFLDEVLKHGGDVNETAGDGLMVIFHDPDPARHAGAAVQTGLAILRRTEEINATLEGFFEPIRMHVGINSGIASLGVTKIEGAAGTRWTYTASGTTTNLASRLAALGDGGHVVVSEETFRRLGEGFVAEEAGPQALKGVAHPVRTYRVTGGPTDTAPAAARPSDRRQHPRRPVAWPARVWVGEECVETHALDASLYGVRVADGGHGLLKVGASYRLELLTGGDVPFQCSVEIRHIGDRGTGMETREPVP